MKKIKEYFTAGRKFGFTCWAMAQNYREVPKTIARNINYFILFKLNDNTTFAWMRNQWVGAKCAVLKGNDEVARSDWSSEADPSAKHVHLSGPCDFFGRNGN